MPTTEYTTILLQRVGAEMTTTTGARRGGGNSDAALHTVMRIPAVRSGSCL